MKFKTSPAYSFPISKKGEIEDINKLYTPAPNKYSPNKLLLNGPICKIGLSKRPSFKIEKIPGPGSYNIPRKFPNGFKYSIGKKLSNKINNEQSKTPGPGAYKTMSKSQSCFYSFGVKHKEKKIDDGIPGPGKYNLRKNKDLEVSSCVFGRGKRIISYLSLCERKVPGPGRYNCNGNAIKVNYPKFSFGKEERKSAIKSMNEDIPGPGSYNHKEFIGKEGLKISISPKLEFDNYNDNYNNKVGPGKYNKTDLNFYKHKSPSTKIGKFKRFSYSTTDLFSTPGPGKYNLFKTITIIKNKDPTWKIGTAKRKLLIDVDKDIPGPGRYNITKEIGNDSPHYSMGHKQKEKEIKFGSPGPGKYNLSRGITFVHSPSWKIGTNKKLYDIKLNRKVPGPGAYNIRKNSTSGPMYGFSRQKRGFFTINDSPGPGSYHIPCSFEELNTYTRRMGNFNEEFRYI